MRVAYIYLYDGEAPIEYKLTDSEVNIARNLLLGESEFVDFGGLILRSRDIQKVKFTEVSN